MAPSEMCPFVGNPDLNGIGVRVGLYSQWVATLLVTVFNPSDEETVRIVNLLIQSSIFLGLSTQADAETNAVEPVITLFLMCGSLSSVTGDGIGHFSHVSGVFRVLFYTALFSYACWFWFVGLDGMTMPGCREVAFFGRTAVDGWFRSLAKAVSVFGLILSVCLIGVCVYAITRRFRKGFRLALARPRRQRPQVEIGLLVLSMGLIAFSIAIVEYLVRVNNATGLSDVQSVGQLIPLLVGGLEFIIVAWNVLTDGLLWRKRCWFLFGKHL